MIIFCEHLFATFLLTLFSAAVSFGHIFVGYLVNDYIHRHRRRGREQHSGNILGKMPKKKKFEVRDHTKYHSCDPFISHNKKKGKYFVVGRPRKGKDLIQSMIKETTYGEDDEDESVCFVNPENVHYHETMSEVS